MNLKSSTATLFAVALASVSAFAVSLTLPELARRFGPQDIYLPRSVELVTTEVDKLVTASHLVVRATVTPLKTYMSDDQLSLFTDYLVMPTQVILQRRPPAAATRPGPAPRMVITRWGGTMQIEGVKVTQADDHMPPLEAGKEYVLFLTEGQSKDATLAEVNPYAGTWGVRNGAIELIGPTTGYGASFAAVDHIPVSALPAALSR